MGSVLSSSPYLLDTPATDHVVQLSFIFAEKKSFAWGTSNTRDKVHSFYLDALKDCGINEDVVYGGARVEDKW